MWTVKRPIRRVSNTCKKITEKNGDAETANVSKRHFTISDTVSVATERVQSNMNKITAISLELIYITISSHTDQADCWQQTSNYYTYWKYTSINIIRWSIQIPGWHKVFLFQKQMESEEPWTALSSFSPSDSRWASELSRVACHLVTPTQSGTGRQTYWKGG